MKFWPAQTGGSKRVVVRAVSARSRHAPTATSAAPAKRTKAAAIATARKTSAIRRGPALSEIGAPDPDSVSTIADRSTQELVRAAGFHPARPARTRLGRIVERAVTGEGGRIALRAPHPVALSSDPGSQANSRHGYHAEALGKNPYRRRGPAAD